jgi:hypothetical protein
MTVPSASRRTIVPTSAAGCVAPVSRRIRKFPSAESSGRVPDHPDTIAQPLQRTPDEDQASSPPQPPGGSRFGGSFLQLRGPVQDHVDLRQFGFRVAVYHQDSLAVGRDIVIRSSDVRVPEVALVDDFRLSDDQVGRGRHVDAEQCIARLEVQLATVARPRLARAQLQLKPGSARPGRGSAGCTRCNSLSRRYMDHAIYPAFSPDGHWLRYGWRLPAVGSIQISGDVGLIRGAAIRYFSNRNAGLPQRFRRDL